MNWVLLVIAGLFEVGFTTCLSKAKESSGTTATLWLVGFLVSLAISMFLLYKASLTLPLGTAYAVWTGIGAVGTAILGILLFDEPAHAGRLCRGSAWRPGMVRGTLQHRQSDDGIGAARVAPEAGRSAHHGRRAPP